MTPALLCILAITYLAAALTGAWIAHTARAGKSPLPPMAWRKKPAEPVVGEDAVKPQRKL